MPALLARDLGGRAAFKGSGPKNLKKYKLRRTFRLLWQGGAWIDSITDRRVCSTSGTGQRSMPSPHFQSKDVDELLLNARLRDELEPFLDESVHILDCRRLPTQAENEFLAQMLAWERAPVLSISKWFEPELVLAAPDKLSDAQISEL